MNEAAELPSLRPRRRLLGALLLAALLTAVAWIAFGVASRLAAPDLAAFDPAPEFTAPTLSGGALSLGSLAGQAVLLDFGTTTCPGCIGATPKLNRLHERYRDLGLTVLSLNQDAGPEALAAFARARSLRYPVLFDTEGEVARLYRVHAFPTVILLDRRHRLRARHTGAVTEETLDREIRSVLGGG